MPEKTEFAPNTFRWVDLATSDVAAATTFYTSLFGWKAEKVEDPAAGGYTMLKIGGNDVAGLGPKQDPNQPTTWTTYVGVDDADKITEIAQSAGATVIMPPFDVMDVGRMAILADPAGAVFALWQAKTMRGAQLVDEPGTFGWAELASRDVPKAKKFYREVFGWGAKDSETGEMTYTEFTQGDESVAGLMAISPHLPAQVPSYWMPYFNVSDIDGTYAKATKLGAKSMVEVTEIPGQLRFAILTDPQGAMFGLYQSVKK